MGIVLSLSLLLSLQLEQTTTEDIDLISQRATAAQKTCGPVSVYYCLQRLGYDVTLPQVLMHAHVDEKGITLAAMLDLIHKCEPSLSPSAISVDPNRFRSLPIPSILILDGHCVVYDGFQSADGMINVFDPTRKRTVQISELELKHNWKGGVIVFDGADIPLWAFVATIVLSALAVLFFGWLFLLRYVATSRRKVACE
jgi:ABC-type bacteriocin/lantibiotic exporter with double-glycine peptidase domain